MSKKLEGSEPEIGTAVPGRSGEKPGRESGASCDRRKNAPDRRGANKGNGADVSAKTASNKSVTKKSADKRSISKPVTKTAAKPVTKTAAKPVTKPAAKPVTINVKKKVTKSAHKKPVSKNISNKLSKNVTKNAAKKPAPEKSVKDDGRCVSEKLAEILRPDIQPFELLAALESSSSAVWVLWMHLIAVPPGRPELRSLLCHIWDGVTSDVQLSEVLGVHRHTIRKWKQELYDMIDDLPVGTAARD